MVLNSTVSVVPRLINLSIQLENLNIANMYLSIFLTIFGLIANLISLSILIYARNRVPRIIGSNYLIILTSTSSLYLIIQFYMGTYNRMIYFFNIDYDKSFQLFDVNIIVCKLLPYLRYTIQLLNAMATMCFSLERFLAVYFPFKLRSFCKAKRTHLIVASILVSMAIPTYLIPLADLIPSREVTESIYERFNLTRSFNFYALTPSFGSYTCSIVKNRFKILLKFHFLMSLVIFLVYFAIGVSHLAIIAKIKRKSTFSHCNSSALLNHRSQTQMKNNSADLEINRRETSSCRVNRKIQNTKSLVSISLSYVLFNLPYFMIIFYMIGYGIENDERILVLFLEFKLRVQRYFVITEIFQLMNFSVTGLLLFCSGQTFRVHAFKCFRFSTFRNK
jgi:hypothetical protein